MLCVYNHGFESHPDMQTEVIDLIGMQVIRVFSAYYIKNLEN